MVEDCISILYYSLCSLAQQRTNILKDFEKQLLLAVYASLANLVLQYTNRFSLYSIYHLQSRVSLVHLLLIPVIYN